MEDKKQRQMNERSLENLKLGAQARSQGKIRRNTTLLPETIAWLEGQGGVSQTIERLVADIKNGQSNNTHNQIRQPEHQVKLSSNNTHNQINQEDLDEDEEDESDQDDDDSEPSDEEVIRSQAAKNQRLLLDVRILEKDQVELKAKLEAREQEVSQLRSQLEQTTQAAEQWQMVADHVQNQLAEVLNSPAADLEAARDHFLAGLKLGRQAPEYKRTKSVIDRFLAELQKRSPFMA